MNHLSLKNQAVLTAYKKGYRVSPCGRMVMGRTKVLSLQLTHKFSKVYLSFTTNLASGKKVNVMVHKLQAFQMFKEDIFEPFIVVRHINDISTDNRRANITIGTQADNVEDRERNKIPF